MIPRAYRYVLIQSLRPERTGDMSHRGYGAAGSLNGLDAIICPPLAF